MPSPQASGRTIPPLLPLLVTLGLAACGGLEPVATYEPITDPTQLYTRLVLDYRAVNLSTGAPEYATLQLAATPYDIAGAPMAGLPAPTFTSSDTTVVWVTPEGLLQARGAGTRVQVIASLTTGDNIRHEDTAVVNVITSATPPKLASLSIHPVPPGDSAVRTMNIRPWEFGFFPYVRITPVMKAIAKDSLGADVTRQLALDIVSLDPDVARYGEFGLDSHRPGQVRMVVRTMAYGVAMADTAVYTVTWPGLQVVTNVAALDGTPYFSPREIRLAPFGFMIWRNALAGDSVDVVFDDATNVVRPPDLLCQNFDVNNPGSYGSDTGPHCGVGNVMIPGAPDPAVGDVKWTSQIRQFPVPGIYRYHSVRTGAVGQIVVTANPAGTFP